MTAELHRLNAFERKQIERAIGRRARYRYVRPSLRLAADGVIVESPCCSRRVDPAGGVVEIALLQRTERGTWRLYWRDHAAAKWNLHAPHAHLAEALESLTNDPDHLFWQ
jgi:hypothetical protein